VSLLLTDAVAEQELRRLRKKTMIALDESGPKFDWKEIDNNSRVIVTIPVSLLLTDAVTEQELRRLRKKTMIALEECGPKFDWKKIDNALTTHAMKSEFD
jgi:N-acetyl-anhydromuramyl-L-alanine amidase AmpD